MNILSETDGQHGQLHVWSGCKNIDFKKFEWFDKQHSIHKIAFGQSHCLLLTTRGDLYSFGCNKNWQLGVDQSTSQADEPIEIKSLNDVHMVDIACGANHSAAASTSGDVYAWGDTRCGQCGPVLHTSSQGYTTGPVCLDFVRANDDGKASEKKSLSRQPSTSSRASIISHNELKQYAKDGTEELLIQKEKPRIVRIECGDTHTMAMSSTGEVWTWGKGPQLGLNHHHDDVIDSPQHVEFLMGRKVLDISAGANCSFAVVQKLPIATHKSHATETSDKKSDSVKIRRQLSTKSVQPIRISAQRDMESDAISEYSSSHCPLGLEVSQELVLKSSVSTSDIKSSAISEAASSKVSDNSSTESVDQTGELFHTADNSPLVEKKSDKENSDTSSDNKGLMICDDTALIKDNNETVSVNSAQESASHREDIESEITVSEVAEIANDLVASNVPKVLEVNLASSKLSCDPEIREESNEEEPHDYQGAESKSGTVERFTEETNDTNKGSEEDSNSNIEIAEDDGKDVPETNPSIENKGSNSPKILSAEASVDTLRKTTDNDKEISREEAPIDMKSTPSKSSATEDTQGKLESKTQLESQPPTSPTKTVLSIKDVVIPKSRSTFLDQEEAQEFLDRQLSGEEVLSLESSELQQPTPASPLSRGVETVLQYVPNTSTAIAMQEYVTSWTNNVVSNIRSSVETTMDRFGMVPGSDSDTSGDLNNVFIEEIQDKQTESEGVLETLETVQDFPRYGTLPKSISMGGVKVKETNIRTHARRGSLPSGAIYSDTVKTFLREEDVVIETEVLSWGRNDQGQLGLGDVLPRLQPCKIKALSDKRVIKVCAGRNHCLTLTADSQVYGWGCNKDSQLGLPDLTLFTSPMQLKVSPEPVWDIGCGDAHSILLTSARDITTNIYLAGLQHGKQAEDEAEKILEFETIPFRKEMSWVHSLAAGGERCACVSDTNVSGLVKTLHELAASERLFSCKFHRIIHVILKPVLNSDAFQKTESSQLGMTIGFLCDAILCLNDMVCVNQIEVTQVLRETRTLAQLQLLRHADQCVGVFQHFIKCYNDAVCMDSFTQCAKICSSIFTGAKKEVSQLLGGKVSKDNGSNFNALIKFGMSRPKEYAKILGKMAMKFPVHTEEYQRLNSSSKLWQAFGHTVTHETNSAENTAKLWSTASYKLTDALRIPHRRLLCDSKTHQMALQGGGRFSSHTFYLFNDVFVHLQGSSYHTVYQLPTMWIESSGLPETKTNTLVMTMPEDVLSVSFTSAEGKSHWMWALNNAIEQALKLQHSTRAPSQSHSSGLYPAKDRHASYTFTKHAAFKDARYQGMWRKGLLHGQGELQWPDGRHFVGSFKSGMQDGYGKYTIPTSTEQQTETHEGIWRNTKLNGYGFISYSNGDTYEGYFQDGRRHGHGVLKQGKLTSSLASIYIGEWSQDKRSGYGVHENILKGEKYMGLWLEDAQHGNGVIVTIDGVYFEGTFLHNKCTGYGLLITEDGLCYEGEFSGGPVLYGKGTLTMTSGDYIEGTFHGSFSEGIKINGTFYKHQVAPYTPTHAHRFTHVPHHLSKSYGKLSVPAQRKWEEVFDHCCNMLGCTKHTATANTRRAWEKCAAHIEIGKKMSGVTNKSAKKKLTRQASEKIAPILETIPDHSRGHMTVEYYTQIQTYVTKAFECPYHPLGKLLDSLVDVYRATYVGVGAHPKLLQHAVLEVKSFLERIFHIVRILFPDLPESGSAVTVYPEQYSTEGEKEEHSETVSPGALLYPHLLPKIYPPLFTLYALYNEGEDERYWRRIVLWNRQNDLALMSYLGVDQKFWTFDSMKRSGSAFDSGSAQNISRVKDQSYLEAIDTLQGLSTSFSPAEKLSLIQKSFDRINAAMETKMGEAYLWSMDELFPVFQYVVVRARIQHLGAEIHFIDDLIETHLELGELGLMFTTLKACFFQIQNEKIV